MFVTGTAQRRGNNPTGTSMKNVISTPAGIPIGMQLDSGAGRNTSKRKRIAVIGDNDSEGLVIRGRTHREESLGTNPDGTTPPLSGDALRNPDYNVSYQGLGTMRFASPVRIPTIDGNVGILGNVVINGLISADNLTAPVLPTITDFSDDIEMSGGAFDFVKDVGNTTAIAWSYFGLVHIRIHFFWTSKGSADGGIRLKNLPFMFNNATATIGQAMTTDHTTLELGATLMSAGDPSNSDQLRIMDFFHDTKQFNHVQSGTFENSGSIIAEMTYQYDVI